MADESTKPVELQDGIYTCYSVEQGDRMMLVKVEDGEPIFKPVMLSFIHCPKVGRRKPDGTMGEDDQCAYDAMDFIRSKIIGRQVRFVDHFLVAPLKRMSGGMHLSDGTDVAIVLLKAGYATIPSRCPPGMDKDLHADYLAAQTIARGAQAGVHSPEAADRVRLLIPHPPEDHEGFADAIHHTTMKVRIDRVASGTGLLLHVANPDDELEFQAVQACLTGAQANPTTDRYGGPDAYGVAAKHHTERLLLHRVVPMRFEGLDGNGNFLVTITGPNGTTFQEELVKRGLAKVNHATVDKTEAAEKLKEAETEAKVEGRGIWGGAAADGEGAATAGSSGPSGVVVVSSGAQPVTAEGAATNQPAKPAVEYKGAAAFEGNVVQILSGDTIVVRDAATKAYTKVSLAGVRANKISVREGEVRGAQRPPEARVSHEEYTWEAREFLRTTCIGQRVKVRVEYARVMDGDAKEVRAMATVIDCATGVNIGAAVLKRGLAKFFLGRNDVCSCADELRQAEEVARMEKLCIFDVRGQAPSTKITELNRIGEKQGKHYLSFFQRGMVGKKPPVWRAVVETVMSGSSFRVYVPREHCQFTLKLAGIVTPSNAGDSNDPFADESRDFAVTTLQQREVDIMVETVDRAGGFIGYLLHNGKNFALTMLSEGLATCSGPERTLYPHELMHAEKAAKAAKKAIWSDAGAVPAMATKREQQQAARVAVKQSYAKAEGAEWFSVNVTNIDDAANIHVNLVTEEVAASRDAMAPLIAQIGADTDAKKHQPTKGETVVVYFKEDKTWYRGKAAEVFPLDKRADVTFVDFGNTIEASFKEIRQIPEGEEFDVLRTAAPLAVPFKLAYVMNRADTNEFVDEAVAAAWAFVGDVTETFAARLEYTADGGSSKFYTVAVQPGGQTLQQALLKDGLALVNRNVAPTDPKAVTHYLQYQEVARKSHTGMWVHGDFEQDEE